MRNADPVGPRYTSLAWAAILGNEDTFEYLLDKGHDEEELSKVRPIRLSVSFLILIFNHVTGFR